MIIPVINTATLTAVGVALTGTANIGIDGNYFCLAVKYVKDDETKAAIKIEYAAEDRDYFPLCEAAAASLGYKAVTEVAPYSFAASGSYMLLLPKLAPNIRVSAYYSDESLGEGDTAGTIEVKVIDTVTI